MKTRLQKYEGALNKIAEIANERFTDRIEDAIQYGTSIESMTALAYDQRNQDAALTAAGCMSEKLAALLCEALDDAEKVRDIACDAIAEPEAVDASEENKEQIILDLIQLLQTTRAGRDIKSVIMHYSAGRNVELLELFFHGGTSRKVNIEGDSGIQIIMDVCKALN